MTNGMRSNKFDEVDFTCLWAGSLEQSDATSPPSIITAFFVVSFPCRLVVVMFRSKSIGSNLCG